MFAAVAAALSSIALVAASHAATPKEQLKAKQAQAQRVLNEVNALDARFGATVEAWNGARYELGLAQKELAADRASLRVAERQRQLAIARLTIEMVRPSPDWTSWVWTSPLPTAASRSRT